VFVSGSGSVSGSVSARFEHGGHVSVSVKRNFLFGPYAKLTTYQLLVNNTFYLNNLISISLNNLFNILSKKGNNELNNNVVIEDKTNTMPLKTLIMPIYVRMPPASGYMAHWAIFPNAVYGHGHADSDTNDKNSANDDQLVQFYPGKDIRFISFLFCFSFHKQEHKFVWYHHWRCKFFWTYISNIPIKYRVKLYSKIKIAYNSLLLCISKQPK